MKSTDEKDFFQFLIGKKATTRLARRLEEKVDFARKNLLWRKQYMTWQQTIDEAKDIAREQGIEEGARQNAIENAKALLNDGLEAERIARVLQLPLEEVLALREELPAKV